MPIVVVCCLSPIASMLLRSGSEKIVFLKNYSFLFVNLSVCYIVQLIQCLARHCIYCSLLVACASVPVAAWLPDFVRSVATPYGVFCAPYPLMARQFSPRVQQARNSYSRPLGGHKIKVNDLQQILTIKFPPPNFHHQFPTIKFSPPNFHHQFFTTKIVTIKFSPSNVKLDFVTS